MNWRCSLAIYFLASLSPLVANADGTDGTDGDDTGNKDSQIVFVAIDVATATAPESKIISDAGPALGLLTPLVDLGFSYSASSAPLVTGKRSAKTATPWLGKHMDWRKKNAGYVQLYGNLRFPIQQRKGAGFSNEIAFAMAGEVGARIWACSNGEEWIPEGTCVGLGLGMRYQQHLSDFQMGSAILPSGSSVLSFPIFVGLGLNGAQMGAR